MLKYDVLMIMEMLNPSVACWDDKKWALEGQEKATWMTGKGSTRMTGALPLS
ncbi:hypothetical protein [Wolbachia endosymbiont of Cimex lectularius]|uniref:hypothetical protein n=1 Tax=Wolbachia endosymbiont of Cimex lectularius TaxID=246273 RepID=UPI000B13B0B4|nr:hypothetical protein [Wolbachia endosymbiont of Cimex lectularius]